MQRNSQSIQVEYKIYLIQYRPYKGSKKGKQVGSCAKQRLEDNAVLQMMVCLTQTVIFYLFMDNFFTSFRLFFC